MSEDEAAAVVLALRALAADDETPAPPNPWILAARNEAVGLA